MILLVILRILSVYSPFYLLSSHSTVEFTEQSQQTAIASPSPALDESLFHYSLLAIYLISPPTAVALGFLQAPYGKYNRPGLGPTMPPSLAWFLMESPTLWLTILLFPFGRHSSDPRSLLLISPFLLHYFHRTVIYPLRLSRKTGVARFPITVALMVFVFNILNAYLQSRWVSHYKDYEGDRWFWWRFLAGTAIFALGMSINVRSDAALVRLKEEGRGYRIPRGGWFEFVSCPNYFGEIVEWLGWSVMIWFWVGFGFLLYTCANLVPRAGANHKWYLEKFGGEYPKGRKAVIPFLY